MSLDDIKNSISKIPKRIWILFLIMAVGIFLRTYHFREWLAFNPDQARDATVVDNVLSGRSSLLILGPEAGNTHFDLGPWFYHLEIISAKIFGNAPDKLAYPDLLFSLLAIPLFYIFLKRYFTSSLSLALAGLYAFSFFAVKYSRFAWNPNSIPFFVLLFLLGILNLLEPDKKKALWGAVMAGIGIGVGIQLHILLFFILPLVTALTFFYLYLRKYPILPLVGKIGIIFLMVLVTNIGQIAYELRHNGINSHIFLKASERAAVKIEPGEDIKTDVLCQSQSNLHIISSLGNAEQCDFYQTYLKYLKIDKSMTKQPTGYSASIVLAGVIYSLVGYLLLAYFWRTETDGRKKNFLALAGIYGIITFAAMYPIVAQVEPRYFLVSFFLPFIFLGIMVQGLWYRKNILAKGAVALIFVALLALNGATEIKAARQFFAKNANNDKNSFLGETETIADYLKVSSKNANTIYLKGDENYVKRYSKPLGYLLARSGIELNDSENDPDDLNHSAPVFFVAGSSNLKYKIGGKVGAYSRIQQMKMFNNIMIVTPNDDETN